MAETVTPPVAPAPAPTPAPSSPGPVPSIPQPITAETPRSGSAKAKLFEDLRKKVGADPEPAAAEPAPEPAKTKGAKEAADPAKAESGGKKQPSPWRLVDDYKAKVQTLEKELADAKKSSLPEAEVQEVRSRLERAEARAKELEEHIRYVDYSKSQDFQDKYMKPYEKAWERAMSELKELTLGEPGNERAFSPEDMLTLVNMPLGQAREAAKSMFGDFADDVMAQRKEIRRLADEQNMALEEARKNGAEREKQLRDNFTKQQSEMVSFVSDEWKKANEEAINHEKVGQFFKPIDGDEEGNKLLERGYQMVDKALAANPLDPRLNPEQRRSIIRAHSAMRNRAAAFGRLVQQVQKLRAREAELVKELEQFKSTEPTNTQASMPSSTGSMPPNAKDQVFGALRKLAR